jgi:hypothetical protein
MPILLALSVFWWGPLFLCLWRADKRNRSRLAWILAALALSPLGWAAALDISNVRGWMLWFSALAPLLLAELLRKLPQLPPPAAPRSMAAFWGLGTLLVAYGTWSGTAAAECLGSTLLSKTNIDATKGNLGGIRSMLSIYYGDMEGQYPVDLMTLTVNAKYMRTIPRTHSIAFNNTVYHTGSGKLAYFPSREAADDRGGWGYINDPASQDFGTAFINCTHTDYFSKRLSDY